MLVLVDTNLGFTITHELGGDKQFSVSIIDRHNKQVVFCGIGLTLDLNKRLATFITERLFHEERSRRRRCDKCSAELDKDNPKEAGQDRPVDGGEGQV